MKALFRHQSLGILVLAALVSGIGNWITTMALFALLIFRSGGGVESSSGLFLAALGPMLIASPIAGWLCDRFDRKKLMIVSELLSGVAVVGLLFAQHMPLIYALLAIQSAFTALLGPARQSAMPQIVSDELLPQANALLGQLEGMLKIGAPILAGLLLTVASPQQAMLLDVVSYLASALILLRLPALPPVRTVQSTTMPRPRVDRTLQTTPRLLLLFVLIFCVAWILMGFDVLSSLVVRDILRSDEGFFGVLIGAIGLGSVAGSAIVIVRKHQPDPWRDVLIGILLLVALPASLMLVSLFNVATARLLVAACCVIGGVGVGLATVQIGTLLQRGSPPALLGQFSGLFQATAVGGQLVALLTLPLIVPALLSITNYFAMMTVAMVLVFGATLAVLGATRRREDGIK